MTHDVVQIAVTMPDDDARARQVKLQARHWLLYGVARRHLTALANTVPATSTVDYWLALQRLDALHDPLARPTAEPPFVVDKRVHYATARMAIETLAEFYPPNPEAVAVLDILDRESSKDPDHKGAQPLATAAAGVGGA